MNDEQHKLIQELLKEIFNNVNIWLSFAEAKNGAMIAFNIACISILWNIEWLEREEFLLYLIFTGMLISTVTALLSFLPKTGKSNQREENHYETDNLMFYNDIYKYNKMEYLKALIKRYTKIDIDNQEIQKIEEDYAEEITYNAAVVVRKYKYFNYTLKIEIAMLCLLVLIMIIISVNHVL